MTTTSICDIAQIADFGNSEQSTIGGVAKVGEFFTGTKKFIYYRYYDPDNKQRCQVGEDGEIIIPQVIFLADIFLILTFGAPLDYKNAVIYEIISREFHYAIQKRTTVDLLKKEPKYIGTKAIEFLEELKKTSDRSEVYRLTQTKENIEHRMH